MSGRPIEATDDSGQKERLNKFLAFHLGISRREADEMIAAKKVSINDQVAQLGAKIECDKDQVKVNGNALALRQRFSYYQLNKPVGYVCSRRRQGDAPTIFELLPKEMRHLKSVGRLDKDSSGLILLSDDGNFANRMTHPSYQKNKIYEVELDKALAPLHRQMIADFGVEIGDGVSKLGLTRLKDDNDKKWRVEMSEGRNRQIRRTFAALGYTVTKLHRTNFGRYSLGKQKPGTWIEISS